VVVRTEGPRWWRGPRMGTVGPRGSHWVGGAAGGTQSMVVNSGAVGGRWRLRKWLRPTSLAGDLGSRSVTIEEEWAVALQIGSMEEEGAG
jgi:hypothetical protein